MPQMYSLAGPGAPSSSGRPINIFSRKAGKWKVMCFGWSHSVELAYNQSLSHSISFHLHLLLHSTGTQYKYVDVLNPSKAANSGLPPYPADSFVRLAPMPMSAKLFLACSGACQQCVTLFWIHNSLLTYKVLMMEVQVLEGVLFFSLFFGVAPDDQQPLEGSEGGNPEQNSPVASTAPLVSLSSYHSVSCLWYWSCC